MGCKEFERSYTLKDLFDFHIPIVRVETSFKLLECNKFSEGTLLPHVSGNYGKEVKTPMPMH